MIKRRMLTKSILWIVTLVFLVGGYIFYTTPANAAASEKVFTWKLFEAHTMKDWHFQQFPAFIKKVEEATNGRVKIKLYAKGEHPIAREDLINAVKKRQCEIALFQGGVLGGIEPVYAVYDLPMYFSTKIHDMFKLYDATRKEILQPIDDRWNVQELMTFWFPYQRIHANIPVTSWDSLAGKKIRVWTAEQASLIKLMGGIPQLIAWGEVPTALATGLVSGAVTSSGSAYDAGLYDFVKYQTLFEIQLAHSQLTINKDALAELDGTTRETVLKLFKEFETFIREGNFIDAEMDVVNAVKDYGITVVAPSKKFWREVQAKCRDSGLWEEWKKRAGPDGERALQILDSTAKKLEIAK